MSGRSAFGFQDKSRDKPFSSFSSSGAPRESIMHGSSKRSSLNDIDAFVAKFSRSTYATSLRGYGPSGVSVPRLDSSPSKNVRSNVFSGPGRSQNRHDDFSKSRYKDAPFLARPASPIPSGFSSESRDGRISPNIFKSRSDFPQPPRDYFKGNDPMPTQYHGPPSGSYGRQDFRDGSGDSYSGGFAARKKKEDMGPDSSRLSFDVDNEMGPPKRKSSPMGQRYSPPKRRRESSPGGRGGTSTSTWGQEKPTNGRWAIIAPGDTKHRQSHSGQSHGSPSKWPDKYDRPERPVDYPSREPFSKRIERDRPSLDPWKGENAGRRIVDWGDPKLGSTRRDDSRREMWSDRKSSSDSSGTWRVGSSENIVDQRPILPAPPPPPVLSDPFPVTDYSMPLSSGVPAKNKGDIPKTDFKEISSRPQEAKVNPQIIEQCKLKIRELYKKRTAEPGSFFPIHRAQNFDSKLSPLAFRQRLALQFNTQPSPLEIWKCDVVASIEKRVELEDQQKKYMPTKVTPVADISATVPSPSKERPAEHINQSVGIQNVYPLTPSAIAPSSQAHQYSQNYPYQGDGPYSSLQTGGQLAGPQAGPPHGGVGGFNNQPQIMPLMSNFEPVSQSGYSRPRSLLEVPITKPNQARNIPPQPPQSRNLSSSQASQSRNLVAISTKQTPPSQQQIPSQQDNRNWPQMQQGNFNRQPVQQGNLNKQPMQQSNRQPTQQSNVNKQPVQQSNRQPAQQSNINKQPQQQGNYNPPPQQQSNQNRQPLQQAQKHKATGSDDDDDVVFVSEIPSASKVPKVDEKSGNIKLNLLSKQDGSKGYNSPSSSNSSGNTGSGVRQTGPSPQQRPALSSQKSNVAQSQRGTPNTSLSAKAPAKPSVPSPAVASAQQKPVSATSAVASNQSGTQPSETASEQNSELSEFLKVFTERCPLSQKISSLQMNKIRFYHDVKRGIYPSQKYTIVNDILCFKSTPVSNPNITSFAINDEIIDLVHDFFKHRVTAQFLASVLKGHFYGLSNYSFRITELVKNCKLCNSIKSIDNTGKTNIQNANQNNRQSVNSESSKTPVQLPKSSPTSQPNQKTSLSNISPVTQPNQRTSNNVPVASAAKPTSQSVASNSQQQSNKPGQPTPPTVKQTASNVQNVQKVSPSAGKLDSTKPQTVSKAPAPRASSGESAGDIKASTLPEQLTVFNIPDGFTLRVNELQVKNISFYGDVLKGVHPNQKYFICRGILCFKNNNNSKSYIVSLNINEQIIMLIHEYLNHSKNINLHVQKIRQLCAGIADVTSKVSKALESCPVCTANKSSSSEDTPPSESEKPTAAVAQPKPASTGALKPAAAPTKPVTGFPQPKSVSSLQSRNAAAVPQPKPAAPQSKPAAAAPQPKPAAAAPQPKSAGAAPQPKSVAPQPKPAATQPKPASSQIKDLSAFDSVLKVKSVLSNTLASLQSSKISIYSSVKNKKCNIANYEIINDIMCFKFSSNEKPLITTDGIGNDILQLLHEYGHESNVNIMGDVLTKHFCHISNAISRLREVVKKCKVCKEKTNTEVQSNKENLQKAQPSTPVVEKKVITAVAKTPVVEKKVVTPVPRMPTPVAAKKVVAAAPRIASPAVEKKVVAPDTKIQEVKVSTALTKAVPNASAIQTQTPSKIVTLENKTAPTDSAPSSSNVLDKVKHIQAQSEVVKKILSELKTGIKDYTFRGNLLLKKCSVGPSQTKMLKILLPEDKIPEIIGVCHTDFSSHGPQDKVLALLEKHFSPIPNLPALVKEFIQNCSEC